MSARRKSGSDEVEEVTTDQPQAGTEDTQAEPVSKRVPYRILRTSPAVAGVKPHVLAGAAAHHGWDDETLLTADDVNQGVTVWLSRPVSTREG